MAPAPREPYSRRRTPYCTIVNLSSHPCHEELPVSSSMFLSMDFGLRGTFWQQPSRIQTFDGRRTGPPHTSHPKATISQLSQQPTLRLCTRLCVINSSSVIPSMTDLKSISNLLRLSRLLTLLCNSFEFLLPDRVIRARCL